MDDALRELLSRSLDGDLDEAEMAALTGELGDDPALAAELEARRRLRRLVAAAGARMEPPTALDRVMEPLLRSAPAPAPRVRPLYRLLAAAATLVLAVTVSLEVARHRPRPTPPTEAASRRAPSSSDNEIFELAPLPTANPNEDRPLGAVDRLLEERPSDPTPQEPEPLEVIGPLAEDVTGKAEEKMLVAGGSTTSDGADLGSPAAQGAATIRQRAEVAGAPQPVAAADRTGPPAAGGVVRNRDREAAPGAESVGLERTPGRVGRDRAIVVIAGVEVWEGATETCPIGEREIEVTVDGGRVTGVVAAAGKEQPDAGLPLCVPAGLIGSVLPGVGDGFHRGDLTISAPSP